MTDIPEDIMREAMALHKAVTRMPVVEDQVVANARALLAAEKRGEERMRQRIMAGMACPPETSGTVTEVAEYEQVPTERAGRKEG